MYIYVHGTCIEHLLCRSCDINGSMVDKFQLIVFNRQGVDQTLTVNVGECIIENQPVVKLLGLHVDNLLSFSAHIDVICRKAGRKLNVLSRLSKTLSAESKLSIFYSFIVAQFECCAVVWHFL